MNKKILTALVTSAILGVVVASATPQTTFEKGQWQLDLGSQRTEASVEDAAAPNQQVFEFDKGWNFNGGIAYALGDKTALQYRYHSLKTGDYLGVNGGPGLKGHEHEINVIQSLHKNFAAFAGWNSIKAKDADTDFDVVKNNVAQLGLIAKADLGKKVDVYALGAIGTHHTSIFEAGVGFKATKDLDLNVGYRYLKTENVDDTDAKFKGLTVGLSYRFGGSKEEPMAPVVEPVAEVITPASPAPVAEAPKADYYLNSIYFDVDQSNIKSSEVAKADQFVAVAKANPTHIFKIAGNTDSDASSEYNMALSQRRVATVAQYAIDRGVSPDQLRAMYNGENKPVADNSTAAGKAENRRVDLWENK